MTSSFLKRLLVLIPVTVCCSVAVAGISPSRAHASTCLGAFGNPFPAGYSYLTADDPYIEQVTKTFSAKVRASSMVPYYGDDHVITSVSVFGYNGSNYANQNFELGVGVGWWWVGSTSTGTQPLYHSSPTIFSYRKEGSWEGEYDMGPTSIGTGVWNTFALVPVIGTPGRYTFQANGVNWFTDTMAGVNGASYQLNHEDFVGSHTTCDSLDAFWTPLSPLTKASQFNKYSYPAWPSSPWTWCYDNVAKVNYQSWDSTTTPWWSCWPGGASPEPLVTGPNASHNPLAGDRLGPPGP